MGSRSKVTVKWADKSSFLASVERFELRYIDDVKRIIRETAEMIVREAKRRVPVDTGDLKRSIDVRFEKGGLRAVVTVGEYYGINLCPPCW